MEFKNYVESTTNLICETTREFERILMKNKTHCTYEKGIENLCYWISVYASNNKELLTKARDLYIKIKDSDIKELRFGLEPQKRFTEEERQFADYVTYLTLTLN